MGSSAVCTQGFSPTPPTIPRSKFPDFLLFEAFTFLYRVLLATIRDQGLRPCPRCKIIKVDLDRLGTKRDTDSRKKGENLREYLRSKIVLARTWIYQMGYGIASAAVEGLLKPLSLVPTMVCT
jgi:hypothetical protein